MKIKKILFVILWLTIPIGYIFSQQSTEKKDLPFDINSRNPIYESYKPAEKNFLVDNYSVLPNKEDFSVISDTNKSFWSIDVGFKNYPDVMTLGLSIRLYIGKNCYLIPEYCHVYPLKERFEKGIQKGNDFALLFGKNVNIENIKLLLSTGLEIHSEKAFTETGISIGVSEQFPIMKDFYLSVNYKTWLIQNIGFFITTPFSTNYLSFGLSKEL